METIKKKEKSELFNQFKKELKEIDKQIDLLKKQREKLCKDYSKKLHKEWARIMRRTNINDMSKWTPILCKD